MRATLLCLAAALLFGAFVKAARASDCNSGDETIPGRADSSDWRGAIPQGDGDETIPGDPIQAMGVVRSLKAAGISLGGYYIGEAYANSGGVRQGGKYDGALELHADIDFGKAGLWKGLCFHVNAFQIHGKSISDENLEALMAVSDFEARPSTRLREMWFEQHLFDDHVAIKIGQIAADEEFIITDGVEFLLNASFGWPSITDQNLPGGGPAYPFAVPAVRVKVSPNKHVDLLVGVFNGDPANPHCTKDPQICNANGLDFGLNSPAFLIAEGAYRYNQESGLAGTIKVGGWNHFGTSPNQRFDANGARRAITGNPGAPLANNWGLYALFDQLLWRVPGSKQPKGIGIFGRVIAAPSDRNPIDLYADGGFTFSGLIPHRPDDTLGLGFAYSGISNSLHGYDIDSGAPVARNYEAVMEICYTIALASGWTLRPDFQYFWQPGGGIANQAGQRISHAAVFGARTEINF